MKKQIPLAILEAMQPFLGIVESAGFKPVEVDKAFFKIVDTDPKSGFYFQATNQEQTSNGFRISYEAKPRSKESIATVSATVGLTAFGGLFENWVRTVETYNRLKSFFDDPILKQYEQDFQIKFESADADADRVSFNLEQQFWLDEALDDLVRVLDSYKTEENKEEIETRVEEARAIQQEITSSTKSGTFKKMAALFSKIQKSSLKWMKGINPIINQDIIIKILGTRVQPTLGTGIDK